MSNDVYYFVEGIEKVGSAHRTYKAILYYPLYDNTKLPTVVPKYAERFSSTLKWEGSMYDIQNYGQNSKNFPLQDSVLFRFGITNLTIGNQQVYPVVGSAAVFAKPYPKPDPSSSTVLYQDVYNVFMVTKTVPFPLTGKNYTLRYVCTKGSQPAYPA